MSKADFLNPIEFEIEERLRILKTSQIRKEVETWKGAVSTLGNKDVLVRANEFLLELPFIHKGLTREQYCAHCYRVSTMALHFSEKNCEIAGVIGLLHNVLEVSDVTTEKIQQEFGTEISKALSILKVERDLQRDKDYLDKYYNDIKCYSDYLPRVKVVDKLDNLFVLGLNPSDKIRDVYLEEIKDYIVPMASEIETELAEYFNDLINYNQETGHFTKENFEI